MICAGDKQADLDIKRQNASILGLLLKHGSRLSDIFLMDWTNTNTAHRDLAIRQELNPKSEIIFPPLQMQKIPT